MISFCKTKQMNRKRPVAKYTGQRRVDLVNKVCMSATG
jgi:hypothetical protein